MQIRDPKPEIMRLEELALLVKSGDIKLPRFQRPFVWKEVDMLKLLDSIYKGYPIGSILIWNSSQKLTSERSISGLDVDTDENTYFPTNYLLDGQQRLTTLCGALFWNGEDKNSIWNIHFDLDTQTFLHPKEPNLVNLFPLNRIIQTSDFIRQCMKFDHHNKRDEYFRVAERLLKSIKDYKIAVVKIGDMTLEEVAPIFERINSTGRKLTIVDLMMAATWSDRFDLTAEINGIKDACSAVGFDEISDPIILRSISASAGLGINKDDIQRLRSKGALELSDATRNAKQSIVQALEFFRDKIGIKDFSYIPYGFQFTYLAEYLRLVPEPSEESIQHLVEWFWFTSVTRYFGSFNSGQVSKELLVVRGYAQGTRKRLFEYQEIDISRLLFDKFNLRNATSTTFTVLLNSLSPSRTLDDMAIDGSHLNVKSNKFFASFCPQNGGLEKLNISKVISPYSQPTQSLRQLKPFVSVDAHILNNECVRFVQEDNFKEYLSERAGLVSTLLKKLTGCQAKYRPLDNSYEINESEDLDDQVYDEKSE